jgi:hypothetical protein
VQHDAKQSRIFNMCPSGSVITHACKRRSKEKQVTEGDCSPGRDCELLFLERTGTELVGHRPCIRVSVATSLDRILSAVISMFLSIYLA